jgi:tRNA-dihydrouridine synthase
MKNFWQGLAGDYKPFFALAPMEDVTDVAFREMFVRYSKCNDNKCTDNHPQATSPFPAKAQTVLRFGTNILLILRRYLSSKPKPCGWPSDDVCTFVSPLVLFTEFTPSDGLAFGDAKAQEKLRAKLSYSEEQRPIVAQIYNSNPERMESAARLVQELGFDGVDINMGCPVNAVVKQISGSALIKHPDLAVEIIETTRRGAPNIPVSVKTRIGYSSKSEMRDWLAKILSTKVDALTVHLRTRSQFSRVPADWSLMPEIIKLRDEISPNTIIIGNGDVESVEHGKELAEKYGCEGIMVGRAVFGAPDFFMHQDPSLGAIIKSHVGKYDNSEGGVMVHKIKMLKEHLELFDKLLLKPKHKGYHVMRKHFKAYVNGWRGAKDLRAKLMQTNNPEEAREILDAVV